MKAIKYSWGNAYVPEEWNAAVVVPVPKKGDLTDRNNYRGIALMSTTMKVLNGIFAKRLMALITRFGLLDPAQVGFINREEAVAQVACLVEILDRRKLKGQETYLCFVDLAKAYDSVPHEALMMKAERFGIHGRALEWLKSIYKRPRVCCRKADGGFSEERPYDRGVRQGDPLSPALFNVYMDDWLNAPLHQLGIEVEIDTRFGNGSGRERLAALMYADDIVMIAENMGQMRRMANNLSEWSEVTRRGKKVLNHRFHHRRSRKDSISAASTCQIHPNLRRMSIKLKVVLFVNAIPGHDVLKRGGGGGFVAVTANRKLSCVL